VMDCSTTGPYQVNRAILRRGPEPAPFHAGFRNAGTPSVSGRMRRPKPDRTKGRTLSRSQEPNDAPSR
jgi:hypothetical protein